MRKHNFNKFSIRAMPVAAQRKSLQSHTRSTIMVQKQDAGGPPPTTHLRQCIQLSAGDCLALIAARHSMCMGKITYL